MRLDQRAWLGSSDWTYNITESDPIKGTVEIINTGKTPATDTTCRFSGGYFPKTHILTEADITYPESSRILKQGTIFPTQRFPLKVDATPISPDFQKTWFQSVQNEEWIQYFWGYVEYTDTFDRKHWTHFCTAYVPKTKDGTPCTIYNDTDDAKKKRS